jgi:hypothetical protein
MPMSAGNSDQRQSRFSNDTARVKIARDMNGLAPFAVGDKFPGVGFARPLSQLTRWSAVIVDTGDFPPGGDQEYRAGPG